MTDIGQRYDVMTLLPPVRNLRLDTGARVNMEHTLRSTPALPRASFSLVTSVVSRVFAAGAAATAGFAGAAGSVVICVC